VEIQNHKLNEMRTITDLGGVSPDAVNVEIHAESKFDVIELDIARAEVGKK